MDARWGKHHDNPAPIGALRPVEDPARDRAEPCMRCGARWPIVRLHPIITACIETPCPSKALLR